MSHPPTSRRPAPLLVQGRSPHRPGRRALGKALALTALSTALPPIARAQSAKAQSGWPGERAIRLIVPYAVGGFADIRARQLAQRLSAVLGQQIIVDNRGGAGGVIGTDLVAKAAPDGYTFGTGHPAPLSVNVSLMKSLPYDPAKDVVPVIQIESAPLILMAGPSLKARTVKDVIEEAKADPGRLTFGSSGIGGAHHLSGELFANMAGIELTHVPYKGGAPASADLMAGQVSMMFEMGYAALPSLRSGKVRPLAVTATHRLKILPDVPTLAEAGIAGFESYNWQGIIAPAGTPAPIIARLNKELNAILAEPEMIEQIGSTGSDVIGGTPEAFGQMIQAETRKWGDVIRGAGIQAE